MSERLFQQKEICNFLLIAWDKNGKILKVSAFHDENAAHTQSQEYLEDDETAHVVKYYAKFKPAEQPETLLYAYGWFALREEAQS